MVDLAGIIAVIRYIAIFIFGSCAGSFAACTVDRLHSKRDWVRGRSECDDCHHLLKPLDLIPILSWVCLRGKCRYCKKPIGWTSLVLEFVMGVVFIAVVFLLAPVLNTTPEQLLICTDASKSLLLVIWWVMLALFAVLAVYDVKYHLLPNVIVYPLTVFALVYLLIGGLFGGFSNANNWLIESILSLLALAGLYGLIWLVSKGRLVGFGDVKLCVPLSLLLGSWQLALVTLFLANAICVFTVLPRLLRRKVHFNSSTPFGPSLIVATIIVVFASVYIKQFISYYFTMMI